MWRSSHSTAEMEKRPAKFLRVKELGQKDSLELFSKASCLNPAEQITGERIPVDVGMVFCDLEMKRTRRFTSDFTIKYTDLLKFARDKQRKYEIPVVILLEGPAGVGKTTYLKLLQSQWMSEGVGEESTIKELNEYDLLVNLECRNRSCQTLEDLLRLHWPQACNELGYSLVLQSLSAFQLLFLCDGLDEADGTTKQIFKLILGKMNNNMISICTTRPEEVVTFYRLVTMLDTGVKVVHVQIKGVEGKHMQSFIARYHEILRDKKISNLETDSLLAYFKRTENNLVKYWRIPLNLLFLIILWVYDQERVNEVTTVSELYGQINHLITKKALERISRKNTNQSSQILAEKFEGFLELLQKEALISLHKEANILEEEALKRLRNYCEQADIPHEEAIGAFLIQKHVWTKISKDELEVSYTHKTQGEYLAACYIYDVVVNKAIPQDETITRDVMQLFSSYNIPEEICRDIAREAVDIVHNWRQESCFNRMTIQEAFGRILGRNVKFMRFQNVLVMLLGLLYQGHCSDRRLLEEVVFLLNRSGVRAPKQWIDVLKSVKCNKTLAKIIARKYDVIPRITAIQDDDVFAYASLLKDSKPHSISLKLSNCPINTPRLDELLLICADQEIPLGYLGLNDLFRNPTDTFCSSCLIEPLQKAFLKCHVKQYHGQLASSMNIPDSVGVLYISVWNSDGLLPIRRIIQEKEWTIRRFGLCVNVSTFKGLLIRIPVKLLGTICLFLSDIETSDDIRRACDIAESFMPENASSRRRFTRLFFPRFESNPKDLIEKLGEKGVKVEESIFLPSSSRPSSTKEKQEIRKLAHKILSPVGRIEWGRTNNVERSIWDIDSW